MTLFLSVLTLFHSCHGGQQQSETIRIEGRVVNPDGKAVEGADVARTWNVYGGTPRDGVKTDKEGRFSIDVRVRVRAEKGPDRSVALMAEDGDRKLGGIVCLSEKDFTALATIELKPLVTLKVTLDPGDVKLEAKSTKVEISMDKPSEVVGSSEWQSREVCIRLPPGKYSLSVFGPDHQDFLDIELTGKEEEQNLGAVKVGRLLKSK